MSFTPGLYDDVLLSGTAGYGGASFEPQLRHVPDADTLLLLHFDGGVGSFVVDHSPGARHILAKKRLPYLRLETVGAKR